MLSVVRSAYYKWASGKLSHRAMENEQLADKIGDRFKFCVNSKN